MSFFSPSPEGSASRSRTRRFAAKAKAQTASRRAQSAASRGARTRLLPFLDQLETRQLLSGLIQTDQTAYAPGLTANITGAGWQPDETVDLQVVDQTTGQPQAAWTAAADSGGAVSTTWTVANLPGDTLQLSAAGVTSGLTAQADFTDGATLATDRATYAPGATVNISGAGFLAGETVDVEVVRNDGTTYGPWPVVDSADAGQFTTEWTVPTDAPGYSFQVTAAGESSGASASASFTAPTTWVETIPTDFSPGQTASVFAGGFQGDETVDFQVTNETDGNVYPGWSVVRDRWPDSNRLAGAR